MNQISPTEHPLLSRQGQFSLAQRSKPTAPMDPSPSTKEHEISENDIHARVLLAVHQEFLKFGLKFAEDQELAACLAQSATGAFPPLRYNDVGGGRVVVVHALAMFDDLIVSAIAAPAALAELELREEDFETRRRIVLSTNVWAAAAAAAEAETGKGKDQQRSQVKTLGGRF